MEISETLFSQMKGEIMFGQDRFKHLSNYLVCKKLGELEGIAIWRLERKRRKEKEEEEESKFFLTGVGESHLSSQREFLATIHPRIDLLHLLRYSSG